MNTTIVLTGSRDRPSRVNASGLGIGETRGIERGEGTVGGPQEAVIDGACVLIGSRDCSHRVDAGSHGVGGAQGIECGEGPVTSPREAVSNGVCVKVVSRDCSPQVDGGREGALAEACASARGIERGEGAALLAIQLGAKNQKDHTDYFPNVSRNFGSSLFHVVELTATGHSSQRNCRVRSAEQPAGLFSDPSDAKWILFGNDRASQCFERN